MSEAFSIQIHYGSGAGFARYVKELGTDFGLTLELVEAIGTKAFYTGGQLVIRHGRHFSVVLFFSKGPDKERFKLLKEVAKTFLPRVPKVSSTTSVLTCYRSGILAYCLRFM